MPTPGRNDPCRCGSGKKYKKCCLARDQEALHGKRAAIAASVAAKEPAHLSQNSIYVDDDECVNLSNRALRLIREGKLDDAERVRDELRERFPQDIDSIERTAMIEQARGNLATAVEWWNKTLDYMLHHNGFEEEGRDAVREIIRKLERQVAAAGPHEP